MRVIIRRVGSLFWLLGRKSMRSIIPANFKFALLVTFVGCIALFFFDSELWLQSGAFFAGPGTYGILGPAVIALITPILWFIEYRRDEGHFIAFLIGLSLLVLAIASRFSNALGDTHYSDLELLFLLYAGGSHIAYSLLNWQELFKMFGSDAD